MFLPRISIITVSYNAQKYIERCIESVINQTYQNIEYIIIDGDSNDGTLPIIDKYRKNISTFVSEKDYGIYDAYNKGLKLSTGDYVYYLNTDDYLFNCDTIESVVNRIPETARIFYGDIYLEDEGAFIELFKTKKSLRSLRNGNMIHMQSVFIERELLVRVNGFDTRFSIIADNDLMIRVAKMINPTEIFHVNIPVAVFKKGGTSYGKPETVVKERKIMLKEQTNNLSYIFGITKYELRKHIKKLPLLKTMYRKVRRRLYLIRNMIIERSKQ